MQVVVVTVADIADQTKASCSRSGAPKPIIALVAQQISQARHLAYVFQPSRQSPLQADCFQSTDWKPPALAGVARAREVFIVHPYCRSYGSWAEGWRTRKQAHVSRTLPNESVNRRRLVLISRYPKFALQFWSWKATSIKKMLVFDAWQLPKSLFCTLQPVYPRAKGLMKFNYLLASGAWYMMLLRTF